MCVHTLYFFSIKKYNFTNFLICFINFQSQLYVAILPEVAASFTLTNFPTASGTLGITANNLTCTGVPSASSTTVASDTCVPAGDGIYYIL